MCPLAGTDTQLAGSFLNLASLCPQPFCPAPRLLARHAPLPAVSSYHWPMAASTQHESLSTLTGGGAATENAGALPAPAPVLESRAGRGSPDSGGRRGLTTHALPPALTWDKLPAFSGLQLPPQQEVNASRGSEFIDVCEAPCAQHAAYTHAGPQVHSRGPELGDRLERGGMDMSVVWLGLCQVSPSLHRLRVGAIVLGGDTSSEEQCHQQAGSSHPGPWPSRSRSAVPLSPGCFPLAFWLILLAGLLPTESLVIRGLQC